MSDDFDALLDQALAEDALRRETTGLWRCVIEFTDADGESREWTINDWDAIDQAAVLALADLPLNAVHHCNAAVMTAVAKVIEAQLPMIMRGVAYGVDQAGAG